MLETTTQSLFDDTLSWPQQQALKTEVHKLAGGLGIFGYAQASEIAATMEYLLSTKIDQQPRLAQQLSKLLQELKQTLILPAAKLVGSHHQ